MQIVFIDEIDSMCRKRSDKEDETTRRIKTELLRQVDALCAPQ
jgi:vacuolar protein-sorting-associated protein 4